ncbi:MAG: VWA domain-containing protein, partial [Thiolinea sp.]
LVWYRAALAHAAWQQRECVTATDIDAVEELVLAHRRQEQPPQQPPAPPPFSRPPESKLPSPSTSPQSAQGDWGSMNPQQQRSVQVDYAPEKVQQSAGNGIRGMTGGVFMAGRQKGDSACGSRVGKGESGRVNWFGTLVGSLETKNLKLHYHPPKTGRAVLHLILLDTSASVLTQQAFAKAKGVIMNIAREAYLLRERLSILGFGNQQVQTLLPPVRAPKQVQKLLDNLSAGGGTPLNMALEQTRQLVNRLKRQQADLQIQIYILTDGRISALPEVMKLGDECVLIDTEQSAVKRGRGRELAQRLQAAYVALE